MFPEFKPKFMKRIILLFLFSAYLVQLAKSILAKFNNIGEIQLYHHSFSPDKLVG